MRNRRRLAGLLVGAALVAGAPIGSTAIAEPSRDTATIAKSCSAGYTHAVIGGNHKCLRRGQFCANALKRQYRRYGFRCVAGRLR
jgi:hypothetical protein